MNHEKVRQSSRRYIVPEWVPLLLCAGCLEVVLKHSEKARGIYRQIMDCYRLPDLEKAVEKLRDEIPTGPELVRKIKKSSGFDKGRRSNASELRLADAEALQGVMKLMSEYTPLFNPWVDVKKGRMRSRDFGLWWNRIEELIKVGFNNESEQAEGRFKVTAPGSHVLAPAVAARTFGEYHVCRLKEWEKVKVMTFGKRTYDERDIINDTVTRRFHENLSKQSRLAGYGLRHADKIAHAAERWYQYRVAYSGPEEFCKKLQLNTGIALD